jgi:hypothetical protein
MAIIVFCGSGDGGARATSSLLLAAGACELGFQPLHIEVLTEGELSRLVGIEEVPFETSVFTVESGESITERLQVCDRRKPKGSPVIVDMPAQGIRETMLMLSGTKALILLSLREGTADLQRGIRDYQELRNHRRLWNELNRESGRRVSSNVEPPACFLPVGWPAAILPDDFATILCRQGLSLDGERQYPVIHPGIPRFDLLDMGFVDENDRFVLTDEQRDAAVGVARTICGETA